MRLEDALLYVVIEVPPLTGVMPFCEAVIAGGADIIHLGNTLAGAAPAVCELCRRADALLVVSGDAVAARAAGADGLHVADMTAPVGQYRAVLGRNGIVGVSTRTRTDAMLALEMGVDYLLHWAGTGCAAVFGSLPGAAGNALFAAGLQSLDDAQGVIDSGVYRLCIDATLLEDGDSSENAAAFSRLLGRCM